MTRWREERDHGRDNHEAVVAAMETAGHAVLFSGITVAIGLLALVVLPVPFMRSIGMAGALIPLASVLVTLTLTPADPRRHRPARRLAQDPAREQAQQGLDVAGPALIVRRRWVAARRALAMLGVLFVAFLGIKIGAADSASLANSGPAYETLQVLEDGGVTTGALTPIEVLTETDKAELRRPDPGRRRRRRPRPSYRPVPARRSTARPSWCSSPTRRPSTPRACRSCAT